MTAFEKAKVSADFLRSKVKSVPKIGLVLGSGLGALAEQIEVEVAFGFDEIPHYSKPTVAGHGGRLIFGRLNGVSVVCQQGRVHYYEGHLMESVVHPNRTLGLLGIKTMILTNAAGGLQDGMTPGDLMVIRDHINLMGNNPLIGPNIEAFGPRFPDMTNAYSSKGRDILKSLYKELKIRYCEGIYAGLSGPTYETPAEIGYLRVVGADAVGMSTVPETIALRHMGLEVIGISCITNLAAGISASALSHDEVTETGKRVEKTFASLVGQLVKRLS